MRETIPLISTDTNEGLISIDINYRDNMNCLQCSRAIKTKSDMYGWHKTCFTYSFGVPASAKFASINAKNLKFNRENFIDLDQPAEPVSFFGGTYKKYSALLQDNAYILKMGQPEYPELPTVEYLSNQIARELDIPVPDFYMIRFENEMTFVTKNFIHNTSAPVDLQHIHHFREGKEHNCDDLIRIISKETQKPIDIITLIHTILFDALIGNHDRHGRNLALLSHAGRRSLAPIYDNVSYLGLESGSMLKADFHPTGRIATLATQAPSMKDYVIEFKRLGHANFVDAFYKKINVQTINSLIDASHCSMLMKKAISNLILKRYSELKNEIIA